MFLPTPKMNGLGKNHFLNRDFEVTWSQNSRPKQNILNEMSDNHNLT